MKGRRRRRWCRAWALTAWMTAFSAHPQEATRLEQLVVTGRRADTKVTETPQKIDTVSQEDIERTVSRDLTDLLKKNTGVDVIQYPGVLSGIGIRGFRPEFSSINKRSLLLVDGRPAGTTNLATIMSSNVERVEVLKGPASALYGSSAMGGVVNVITRNSTGNPGGALSLGFGSFETTELGARAGGAISEVFDFDYAGGGFAQHDDFKLGNGVVRPNTHYKRGNHAARLGVNLGGDWRLTVHGDTYAGRDIATPGDIAYGTNQQSNKNIDRYGGDIRLTGRFHDNRVSVTTFYGSEWNEYFTKTSSVAADQPFLPFRSFDNTIKWRGVQLQDEWAWGRSASLIVGVDTELAEATSRSYKRDVTRRGPFAADNRRDTLGVYAENTWVLNQDRTALTLGARHDRIKVETLDTPFKANFTPSATSFGTTNPSLGIKHEIIPAVRGHATIGRGFVTPDAGQLTGFDSRVNAATWRTEITQGNPNLKPESSVTWDLGMQWESGTLTGDVTYFSTRVNDKITNVRPPLPPAPQPLIITYQNASDARMHGLEADLGWAMFKGLRLTAGATRMFSRKETISIGERDINNVPALTLRVVLDAEHGPWSGRLAARHVGERKDDDFVFGRGQIVYDSFTLVDLAVRYRIDRQHSFALQIDNLTNKFYYEKLGFPLQGRSIYGGYRYEF